MRISADSRLGRAVRRAATTRLFREVIGPKVVPALDRVMSRLSGGRIQLAQMIVDSLELTTIGRKSGQERTVNVAYFVVDDAIYIVGSNYGRPSPPAWTLNLEAEPSARIRRAGHDWESVNGAKLDEDERAAIWPRLLDQWSAFAAYEETAGDRTIPVFRLDPA